MTAILDTNVIIRHLTGQPAENGAAASWFLAEADTLVLTHVIVAETVHVLRSVYQAPVAMIALSLRALLAMRSIDCERDHVIRRAIDLYEIDHMDFTDAYLVAVAESDGRDRIASFDRGMDKILRHASTVRQQCES